MRRGVDRYEVRPSSLLSLVRKLLTGTLFLNLSIAAASITAAISNLTSVPRACHKSGLVFLWACSGAHAVDLPCLYGFQADAY